MVICLSASWQRPLPLTRSDSAFQRYFHPLLDDAVGVGQFGLGAMPVGLDPLVVRGCCDSEGLSCADGDLPRELELEDAGGVKLTRSAHRQLLFRIHYSGIFCSAS